MLMKLERISPAGGGGISGGGAKSETGDGSAEVDDEEALRHWADLRECQQRFAQAGGFLAEL